MQQDILKPGGLSPMPYINKITGAALTNCAYTVYGASGKMERIMAQTASEAIKNTTIKNPVRVLRYDPLSQVLLSGADFTFSKIEVANAALCSEAKPVQPPAEQVPLEAANETPHTNPPAA